MRVYVIVDFCGEPTVCGNPEALLYNLNADYFYDASETTKIYIKDVLKDSQSIKQFIGYFEKLLIDSRVIFYCGDDNSTRAETVWVSYVEGAVK